MLPNSRVNPSSKHLKLQPSLVSLLENMIRSAVRATGSGPQVSHASPGPLRPPGALWEHLAWCWPRFSTNYSTCRCSPMRRHRIDDRTPRSGAVHCSATAGAEGCTSIPWGRGSRGNAGVCVWVFGEGSVAGGWAVLPFCRPYPDPDLCSDYCNTCFSFLT